MDGGRGIMRLWTVLLICLSVLFSGMNFVAADDAPVIRLSYNALPFNLPSIIEREQGFLAAEGYEARYYTFQIGHAMTEAMTAGDLDVAPVMGATSAIVSKAGGRDIQVIGCYSQAPKAFGLAVRPGTLSLDELSGAVIAVPIGTEAHVLLGKILAEQGLTFQDVVLANLLIPDGVAALQGGQVDASMVVEPVMSRLEAAGKIQVIRDGRGLIGGLTLSVVAEHLVGSGLVQAFCRAHAKSTAYLTENFDKVLDLAAAELNLPLPLVKGIASKYSFQSEITDEVRAELVRIIDFLYEERIIRRRITLEELLAP